MSSHGYSRITKEAMTAFATTLDTGAWGQIANLPLDTPAHWEALLLAPLLPSLKAKLRFHLQLLIAASARSNQTLEALDDDWDAAQRQLHYALLSHEVSRDPVIKAAAQRLRAPLFGTRHTSQTLLDLQQEVEFGAHMLQTAQQAQVKKDIEALQLETHMARVQTTTSALQEAMKLNNLSRGTSISQAKALCVGAFNAIHDQLEELAPHLPPGPQQALLHQLLATLQTLLDRPAPLPRPAAPPEAPPEGSIPTPNVPIPNAPFLP